MEREKVYIVLTRTNTVISRLIHTIKNDNYTHAAISLDENLEQMYSFGRKFTFNPFIGVFRKEEIDKGAYRVSPTVPSVIIEIQVSKEQYEKVKEILECFIANSSHYKYNYIGLLHNLLQKSVCYENKFLCSEFVYYILNESGIVDFNKSRNLVRPENFLNVEGKIIFEGDLKTIEFTHEVSVMDEIEFN